MSTVGDIKLKLKEVLDTLVPDHLNEVQLRQHSIDVLNDANIATPLIVIQPPSIQSEVASSSQITRSYEFNMPVILTVDNVVGNTYVEDLQETIMDTLDRRINGLEGTANAGISPAVSPVEPITNNGRTYLLFGIIVVAKVIKEIRFV